MNKIDDTRLQLLIETYCFQNPGSLTMHQKDLLSALNELKKLRKEAETYKEKAWRYDELNT